LNGQGAGLEPLLEVIALHKSFGALEVLKGIDLQVAPRELVFVIGPSGSGKSTLLRCCNRLEEPTSGSVRVHGTDICAPGVDLNRVRQKIGFVFQSFNLYPHMNALGNVTLALRKVQGAGRAEAEEKGRAALARVGLAEKAAAYPNELSGGQQQRVAIARALALEPSIVLFDELRVERARRRRAAGDARAARIGDDNGRREPRALVRARRRRPRGVHGPRPDRRAGPARQDLRWRGQPARARVRRVDLRASLKWRRSGSSGRVASPTAASSGRSGASSSRTARASSRRSVIPAKAGIQKS
jgi:ABC-type lipoprotein export system ATPase subunit